MSRSSVAAEAVLQLLTMWAEQPTGDSAVHFHGEVSFSVERVQMDLFYDPVEVVQEHRPHVGWAENRFAPLIVSPYSRSVVIRHMREIHVSPLLLSREWVHDEPVCDWVLMVSVDDLLRGVKMADLPCEYARLARRLRRNGINDTRTWRAVYDGVPLEYAVAMFAEEAA